MGAAARMVTIMALDISVTAWRKAHPSDERHVAHADVAEAETERARMIRQLSDDAAEWEALGREEHAAKARAAADRLRDRRAGEPPGSKAWRSKSDAYTAAMLRAAGRKKRTDGR